METEAFPQGLKKEFFPRLQNIEPALVPYKPSSLVRNQENNILGQRRRIVGSNPGNWKIASNLRANVLGSAPR